MEYYLQIAQESIRNLEFYNVKWSFKIENKMKTFSDKQDLESLLPKDLQWKNY